MSETTTDASSELLGFFAFLRMAAYARVARDVSMTKEYADQLVLARIGRIFIGGIDAIEDLGQSRGADLAARTQPFVGYLDDMEARTRPADWWERIVKSYVMVGMLVDLESALQEGLDAQGRELIAVSADIGHEQWVRETILAPLEQDPMLRARLSMWGRRVGGEVLGSVQRLLVKFPQLLPPGADNSQILEFLSAAHSRRLAAIDLAA